MHSNINRNKKTIIILILFLIITAFLAGAQETTFNSPSKLVQAKGAAGKVPKPNTADIQLLARAINGEARGEVYKGQVAVGAVILNRVRSSKFPKTIAGVIYQPGAFDAVRDGQINLEPDKDSFNAARDALNGWDPTYGCVYYWNPATATSKWIWSRPIRVTIGRHVFAA